jgi:arabinose-5-phosphate isomerase
VATVHLDDNLRKVVIEMTEKPQGAALVMDGDSTLLGIVTEGDLRRCLAENGDIDQLKVSEVMTENPVSVNLDAPLNDAVTLMEDRKSQISVLPVVNGDGKSCAGLLRLHDVYQTRLF